MTATQGLPSPSVPIASREGDVTPAWRYFLASIWSRTGGSDGGSFAPINGSPNNVFAVAPAVAPDQAAQLAQVQSNIRSLPGQPVSAVALTASPMTWIAPGSGALAVGGNGVQSISLTRSGISISIARNYGEVLVRQGDTLTITYIGTPTLNWIPD